MDNSDITNVEGILDGVKNVDGVGEIEAFAQKLIAQNDVSALRSSARDFIKMMTYYKAAAAEIETKFKILDDEFSFQYDRNPIESVKIRVKPPASIIEKLKRKNLPVSIESIEENLNDIAGIRVVCSFVDDVYELASTFLCQDDVNLISMKDYIKNPKKNGYRSLHLIVEVPIFLAKEKKLVKAEVQLRTIAMDFWASLEHQMRYKKNNVFTPEMTKELYDCATLSEELDRRMNELKTVILS